MPAAVRSYLTMGMALMGVGVVTAAQITPPLQQAETRIVQAAVTLAAAVGNGQPCSGYNTDGCDPAAPQTYTPLVLNQSGNPANIAANIINAVASIPRAVVDAVNELSYALEITGNWWVYGPNNVLGSDPADPAKYTALTDLLIPFKPVSNAVGEQLSWWGKANLPMGAGCTATVGPLCKDLNSLLATMFLAPIWTLAAGYQFPTVINPVSEAEGTVGEEIPGSVGTATAWSGAYVKLNLFDPAIALFNYLLADPSVNTPKPVTGPEITATMQRLGKALALDFYPFVQGSFLLKGWPYTVFTPLFKPFIKFLCPDCDAENPGVLPKPTPESAATTLVSASAVADSTTAPAPATEAVADTPKDEAAQTPAASVGEPGSAKAKTPAAAVSIAPAASDTPAAVDSTDTATVAAPAKAADLPSKPVSTPRRGAQGSRTPAGAAPAAADQGGPAAKTRVRAAASGE